MANFAHPAQCHSLMFQGIVLPSGMIGSFWGPWLGSGNDKEMVLESGLMDWIEANWPANFKIVGDAGYALSNRIIIPFSAEAPLTADEKVRHSVTAGNASHAGHRGLTSGFRVVDRLSNGLLELKVLG